MNATSSSKVLALRMHPLSTGPDGKPVDFMFVQFTSLRVGSRTVQGWRLVYERSAAARMTEADARSFVARNYIHGEPVEIQNA